MVIFTVATMRTSDLVSLMYQSTQQFYNKQINTVSVFVYCVEILLCVSNLLHHHQAVITLHCVVYRYGSRSMIYKFWLLHLNYKNEHFIKDKIPIDIKFKICNSSDYFSWWDGVWCTVWGFLGSRRCFSFYFLVYNAVWWSVWLYILVLHKGLSVYGETILSVMCCAALYCTNNTPRERQQEDGALPCRIQHNTQDSSIIVAQTIMK
jgi:hypothetical protein